MIYVDVILPIPLNVSFTYQVPDGMPHVERGMRVLVPFGKTKTQIGIVTKCYNDCEEKKDASYKIKPILEVLDTKPSLTENQFKLWQWIADYYISPLGDIFKAAMPSGLKAEGNYRPKTEQCVDLPEKLREERTLHLILDSLSRATMQRKAMETFLDLSHWASSLSQTAIDKDRGVILPRLITRDELMNASHVSAAVVKQLIDKGFLVTREREVGRLNTDAPYCPETINCLNEYQQKSYGEIGKSFESHNVTLLHGVTSSGKTEIYIHLIQEQIEKGNQVLYLLPEIALTVQIMQRLKRIFGRRLGIYHSKYSDAERVEIWNKQLSDEPYDVILGVRSSVFLPFKRLGLVIIDEEHETSYKQQDPAPRYHARSVAIMLAKMYGAKTLLGTATPSLETMYNAQTGKYGLVTLTHRHQDVSLPEICIVDVKDLQRRLVMRTPFSPLLTESIREALANDEQVILFQNRRGFNSMIECKDCGWVPKCTACDVSLTYHKSADILTCHYCGHTYTIPEKCPVCGGKNLRGKGIGTEKIEEYVAEMFPQARVARMDLDTTRTRSAYERIISDFAAGRTNLLIGTQMVSKGLDFDRVSVVGIMDADTMLNYPDFRAYEQSFMMMTQVSGRAGRRGKRGKVILQTKNANLPLIHHVVENDYNAFYNDTLAERQFFHYPPFYHIIYIYVKHKNADVVEKASHELGYNLTKIFGERILGPDKPAVGRVQSLHIRKIVVKIENGLSLSRVREYLIKAQDELLNSNRYPSLQMYYDVDPL
ncbi:MAG: primosomal protein N' [Prevotellaceae bacterium]|nr:primosomal protein N' [Prevotellaceae bacterium]